MPGLPRQARARARKVTKTLVLLLLALIITVPPLQNAHATSPTYQYNRQWGSFGGPSAPNMMAIDAAGNIYIADTQNKAVGKLSRNGTLLGLWGGPSQFSNPMGIAIDNPRHYVYVSDSINNNVYKYDTTGNLLATWNSNGNGTQQGQFIHPQGIAVNSTGYVYIVDQGNRRIGIFSSTGSFVKYFSLATPGKFVSAVGIAIDPPGTVYVSDATSRGSDSPYAGNITQYTKNGTMGSTWGGLLIPEQLTVDNSSNIYAADSFAGRVQKFNINNQNLLLNIGSLGTGTGQLTTPIGVALDGSGNVLAGDQTNLKIQKYSTTTGSYQTTLGYQMPSRFTTPTGAALDGLGNIYIVDTDNNRVQKFNSSTGGFITAWGTYGKLSGQFDGPTGVAVDHNGYLYVTDSGNGRVERFLLNGTYSAYWNLTRIPGDLGLPNPFGIASDSTSNLYVTDITNSRVEKFGSSGNLIQQWGTNGSADGNFYNPAGVAVDPSNSVYVVDSRNNRIQEFTGSGGFLTKWGLLGSGPSQFDAPRGIALDTGGNIYVADTFNNRVEVFYSDRTLLATFGTSGTGNGQFGYTTGIVVDSSDNVYVTDSSTGTTNQRVEVFSPLHDVATTKLALSRKTSYNGVQFSLGVKLNVSVSNYGLSTETFWVRELANLTIIGQQNVTLAPGQSSIVPFSWFPSLPTGKYNITSQVQQVAGDPNVANNVVKAGLFYIRLKGDVSGDCKVDIVDMATVGTGFGAYSAGPGWNANADQNNDGTINIVDLVLTAGSFGSTLPTCPY